MKNQQINADTYVMPFSLEANYKLCKSSDDSGKKGIADIQGILSSQSTDTQGETIFISGMDITPLNSGMAQINWWHLGRQNPSMVIGLIDWAKKINNDTAVAFKGHLLNTDSGRAAKELMEAMEAEGKHIGVSVEGSTIVRDGSKIYRSVARGCALATDQVNKECTAELIKAIQDYSISDTLQFPFAKAISVNGDAPYNQSPITSTNFGLETFNSVFKRLCKEYPDINPDLIKKLLLKYSQDEQS